MDMVTMNIIDSTMVSICREMGITMMKTSYSTIFNEGLDFTCGLGNPQGELIGVAEFNPSQIGGMPLVMQTAVQEIPLETLEDGDILVHNAGSATRGLSAVDTTDAEYLDAMELHCLAAVRLTRALASQLRSAEHANVVIVTSSIAAGGGPGIGPYHAAKAAAEAFAHTLAHEERANGIRVNIVRPGFTDTDMGRRLAKSMTGSDDLRRWDAAAPFGRVGRPEDIGNVIAFLCSEGGAYVTNQVICVDGGQATIGGATDVMMRTGKPA